MSNILNTNKEANWLALGKNLVQTATDNASTLGLTASQVSGLQNLYNLFENDLALVETKTAEKESAVKQKDASFSAFEVLVRRYAKQWRANTNVSNALLAQLQLAPRSAGPSYTTPTQPLAVTAEVNSVGEVTLKWKRNGNISTTTFIVQAQTGPDTWNVIKTTTKTKTTFNSPLGVEATFRVIATRRGVDSSPSFPVTIFDSGETLLSIAA